MSYPVVPAIIPESAAHVKELVSRLGFVREIQLDLVDGVFVPQSSWPYSPEGKPIEVKSATDPFTLEVDLMVSKPIAAATEWIKAGADMLVFHIETLPLEVLKNFAENTGVSIGVAAHGDTSMEKLIEYAKCADYVQLMGIKTIGAQSLPFDEETLDKVAVIRRNFPDMMISVDGSVNKKTITRLRDAGVDRFIVGSAIVKQPDVKEAYHELWSLVNE